jgi:GT2 family glycosyltransferase
LDVTSSAPGHSSIVIPAHGRAGLTRQCIETILDEPPRAAFELIVVDDASPDDTAEILRSYEGRIKVVERSENGGFARACNDGAAESTGQYLVFLNNDTVPVAGWLDALVEAADSDSGVAVVGSKLLFPNNTVQHAGVVVCQDGNPRHIYAGFPADHPAVSRPRRFQAVTAASMLVRRDAFERAGGFDPVFRNCLEDTDLCIRLGQLGYEIRYCPESVVYHLESVSRGRRTKEIAANTKIFKERWDGTVERDDLRRYVEDGLLRIRYRDTYPVRIELAPELASIAESDSDRFVERQSQQIADLLRETVRLSAHVADLELAEGGPSTRRSGRPSSPRPPVAQTGIEGLAQDAERLQLEILEFQGRIADALQADGGPTRFIPGARLDYVDLRGRIRAVVEAIVPREAVVLVVSRGDDMLLELDGRDGRHFLQEADGAYAGRHPASSDEAISQLERLRTAGAGYLVIPELDSWWLEHYVDFGRHLTERYELLTSESSPCAVFRL